jgi:hypothetical protein
VDKGDISATSAKTAAVETSLVGSATAAAIKKIVIQASRQAL